MADDSTRASSPTSPLSESPPVPPMLAPTFPPEFLTFLTANSLSPSHYSRLLLAALASPSPRPTVPSRFVHPISPSSTLPIPAPSEIAASLSLPPADLIPVPWLPSSGPLHFFRLPGSTPISYSDLYRSGQLQALDAASAVAVLALSVAPDDHILDLCCAPGGKLALCAESVRHGRGTVTGVDVSKDRMFVSRTLMRKLGAGGKARMFVADGRTFDLGVGRLERMWRQKEFGSEAEEEKERDERDDENWGGWERDKVESAWVEGDDGVTPGKVVKALVVPSRFEKSATGRGPQGVFVPYDKVLVDAECTHDGSISHLLKYLTLTPSTSPSAPPTFTFPQALLTSLLSSVASPTSSDTHSPLANLQLSLLLNGFRLLRPGGLLVYSTCSLSIQQGEAVVQRFLDLINAGEGEGGSRAVLEDVPGRELMPCEERDHRWLEGRAVRFSGGLKEGKEDEWVSGLFVCRLKKIW